MVIYFSGTGNSRYCAQLLSTQLGEELVDAFPFIRDNVAPQLCSAGPWVFVAPTYGWQIPRIFANFLHSGRFDGCKSAYFVMTCGSEIGSAGQRLDALCREMGLVYQGVLEVVMPENYVAMFPVPDTAEALQIIAAARPVLEAGVECIRRGRPFPPQRRSVADRLKTSMVNPLFYSLCIRAKSFYATDACTGCGKCERGCPLRNIRLEAGRPIWGSACTHCMSCICGCPAEAVEYGRRSVGKPRYQCEEYTQG